MSENEFSEAIVDFFKILDSLKLKAHITGGLASSFYGEPRFTQDVDVVVEPVRLKEKLADFISLLKSSYIFSEDNIKSSLVSGRVFQLIDEKTSFKFDLYPREGVPGELSRGRLVELFPSQKLPILSLTDCVISKLQWIQKGSVKSTLDVKGIFKRISEKEKEHVLAIAKEHQLEDLLISVLNSQSEPLN